MEISVKSSFAIAFTLSPPSLFINRLTICFLASEREGMLLKSVEYTSWKVIVEEDTGIDIETGPGPGPEPEPEPEPELERGPEPEPGPELERGPDMDMEVGIEVEAVREGGILVGVGAEGVSESCKGIPMDKPVLGNGEGEIAFIEELRVIETILGFE